MAARIILELSCTLVRAQYYKNNISVSRETESDRVSTSGSGSGDNEQLSKCIRREVAKLSDKWSALLTQLELWQRRLDDTLPVSQFGFTIVVTRVPYPLLHNVMVFMLLKF